MTDCLGSHSRQLTGHDQNQVSCLPGQGLARAPSCLSQGTGCWGGGEKTERRESGGFAPPTPRAAQLACLPVSWALGSFPVSLEEDNPSASFPLAEVMTQAEEAGAALQVLASQVPPPPVLVLGLPHRIPNYSGHWESLSFQPLNTCPHCPRLGGGGRGSLVPL